LAQPFYKKVVCVCFWLNLFIKRLCVFVFGSTFL
jgi:hypothetical protein